MDWPKGATLSGDQTGHPILWHGTLAELGYGEVVALPELEPQWFYDLWGERKTTRRLKTFGHKVGKESTSPHFLCSRGGLPLHTDPGYTRYALQIQLHNQGGFIVHGLEDDPKRMPLFLPGLAILLDTWSPHQVARDPRLPQTGPNKLLVGADYANYPDIDSELPKLVEHIPLLAYQHAA
jgi:hypothetical protein